MATHAPGGRPLPGAKRRSRARKRDLPAPQAPSPVALRCPYCVNPPLLEVFRRYETITDEPLRYCPRCFGFWAARDALARGVADPGQEHPALRARPMPPRCRSCAGRLDANEACRDCRKKLPLLNCPACGTRMNRTEKGPVKLDACGPCHAVWFDGGEISAVYNLAPPQGWASSYVDDDGPEDGPLFLEALRLLLALFLPL